MVGRVKLFFIKYKSPDIEVDCVESILRWTHWPYSLVIHDNRGGTKNMADLWNELVMGCDDEYLGFIDSDTKVGAFWLTRMMSVLMKRDAGAVVPRTNNCGEVKQVEAGPCDQWSKLYHASGFCFIFKREAYEDIGKFDNEFVFYGQDADWFSRMAYCSKWNVYLQPEAFVHHIGHNSVNESVEDYDFAEDKKQAMNLYYKKVGLYTSQGAKYDLSKER